MSTILRKLCPLGWACLFSASTVAFAQTGNAPIAFTNFTTSSLLFSRTDTNPTAASLEDGTTTQKPDNAAAASLERTLARAVMANFLPPGFSIDPGFADEESSFTGGVLLAQAQGNPSNPAKPTATNPSEPTLGDLGFPTAQTQGSAQDQARLDKRSHMLKIHQRLGLITTIPLAATLITSSMAGGRSSTSTGRDLHATLGTITAGMYLTTAYYAIFAPKITGTPTRGPIRLHKALAFIHGPGMILTPILGAMALNQKNAGEKVHGIASAHGAVAAITGIAYGLAIVSVSVHF